MTPLPARLPKTRSGVLAGTILLVLCLGTIDYFTGDELGFFVFYYIPIAISAWYGRRSRGIALALLSAIVWFTCDLLTHDPYSSPFFPLWNTGVRLAAFLILVVTASRIREHLESERRLAAELTLALKEVKQLKGLLPICAWCKQVRNDEGYWEQIEAYVTTRTDAAFTHSVCPDCAQNFRARELGSDAVV